MVLKILTDIKGQLTVASPSLSAEGSMPCTHRLPALGSPHLKPREPVVAPGRSGQEPVPSEGVIVQLVNF